MVGEFYARRAGEQMEQKALMEVGAAATSQEFYTTLPLPRTYSQFFNVIGNNGFQCCNVTRILYNASPSQNLLTTLPLKTPTYPAVIPDLNVEGYTAVMVNFSI